MIISLILSIFIIHHRIVRYATDIIDNLESKITINDFVEALRISEILKKMESAYLQPFNYIKNNYTYEESELYFKLIYYLHIQTFIIIITLILSFIY